MRIDLESQPQGQIKLTIEVSPEEMQPYLDRAAEVLSRQHKIAGFRPGKASLGIVIQKLGAQAVWEEAAEAAVRRSFVTTVKEKEIDAVGQPHIHIIKLAPDNPLIFTAHVSVLPPIAVGDYALFKAKPEPITVAAEKIEAAIEDMRKMFATQEKVDRPAGHGDRTDIDFELTIDGVPMENGTGKNHPVVIGSKQFVPGFEENLVGLKAGETKEFSVTFPTEYHHRPLAGKQGRFKVKVNTVYQITKPELNDEFAKKAGQFSTISDLRTKLEANLREEATDESDRRFEKAIMDELIARSRFGDLPAVLIDNEVEKMLSELKEEIARHGSPSFDDYLQGIKKSVDELKKEFRPQAETRVKAALLIRSIAKKEKIMAEDKQVEEEVTSTKQMYQGSPEILERIESEDYRDYLRTLQVNRRVVELLKERARKAE